MAINKNHEFEELDGVKCAIVGKNAPKERVAFLKELLEFNKFTVIAVPSPPPKAAVQVVQKEGEPPVPPHPLPPAPETFTVGVTDVVFNPTNAIFGRTLRTKDGHVVTLAYWKQKETVSHDEIPYYETKL